MPARVAPPAAPRVAPAPAAAARRATADGAQRSCADTHREYTAHFFYLLCPTAGQKKISNSYPFIPALAVPILLAYIEVLSLLGRPGRGLPSSGTQGLTMLAYFSGCVLLTWPAHCRNLSLAVFLPTSEMSVNESCIFSAPGTLHHT